MVTTRAGYRWVGATLLLAACGGDPFVFNPDAAAGGPDANDTSPDTGRDAASLSSAVLCPGNNQPCSRALNPPQTCCTSVDPAHPSSCTGGSCGCDTQLECASDFNCALPTPVCCIGTRTDSACSAGHRYAQCRSVCVGGESRLCDPRSARCPAARPTCSADSGDLQSVGLPSGQGYGVCM
jgi:hypothetical protein